MHTELRRQRTAWFWAAALMALLYAGLLLVSEAAGGAPIDAGEGAESLTFVPVATGGFGDVDNSGAWSMQWWNGNLYVGTVREFDCWVAAEKRTIDPTTPYPPTDPDKHCAADVQDLSLQAEIWRYTPTTARWVLVFRSPKDVPIPGRPGKFTGRDAGFRAMGLYVEEDGTEALYVSGVYPQTVNPGGYPRPRILRSTDGTTFEAIPEDPGTFLGDLTNPGYRGIVTYRDRMYIVASSSVWGAGAVLEAEHPEGGNDNFRTITPTDTYVFSLLPFNGYLYVGTSTSPLTEPPATVGLPGAQVLASLPQPVSGEGEPGEPVEGYSVLKTDATGEPPYLFTPIITQGGYLADPAEGVVTLAEYDERLYAGTDSPADILRLNPDDTWDLLVGTPRMTPDGWKQPLSGLDAGFGWEFNIHMWSMDVHEGVLYVGTADMSTSQRLDEEMRRRFGDRFGFDLYATSDGVYFTPITTNGFGDEFQMGARTTASTPYGFFLGCVNYWTGLEVLRGSAPSSVKLYLPVLTLDTGQRAQGGQRASLSSRALGMPGSWQRAGRSLLAPARVEAETVDGQVVLAWEGPAAETRFHVFRSEYLPEPNIAADASASESWLPGPYVEVGTTDQFYFVDANTHDDAYYYYYVLAEDKAGHMSGYSNLSRAPSLAPQITFASLQDTVADWARRGRFKVTSAGERLDQMLAQARDSAREGDLVASRRTIEQVRFEVAQGAGTLLETWCAHDLEMMLSRFGRRLHLVQLGLLSASVLE